jgi:endonuclease/exonuclease/phosphatase (EEP) superfamily protein YafD
MLESHIRVSSGAKSSRQFKPYLHREAKPGRFGFIGELDPLIPLAVALPVSTTFDFAGNREANNRSAAIVKPERFGECAAMIVLLTALTGIIVIMTLVPLLPIPHGIVRVCDFPRLQIAAVAIGLAPLTFFTLGFQDGALLLMAAQFCVLVVQTAICLRFTPLWRVQSVLSDGQADDPAVVRILAANVKMSNRHFGKLIALVRERDPHIAIFMEVDGAWTSALTELKERLPFAVERPQDDAYGMALYSRLPLVDPLVRFLVLDEVPSIRTTVVLPNGRHFRLHVLHPEPPVPAADTLGRDGELILTAREVNSDPLPAIVAGDLNDVAWSRTTRRFQRLSGLLDPRVGRGFYNTFDARFAFLRWPLDHLFHDARFRLVSLERMPDIGSDHFPMLFELALARTEAADEAPDLPDSGDQAEASDVVRRAADLDREPIGTDWESDARP